MSLHFRERFRADFSCKISLALGAEQEEHWSENTYIKHHYWAWIWVWGEYKGHVFVHAWIVFTFFCILNSFVVTMQLFPDWKCVFDALRLLKTGSLCSMWWECSSNRSHYRLLHLVCCSIRLQANYLYLFFLYLAYLMKISIVLLTNTVVFKKIVYLMRNNTVVSCWPCLQCRSWPHIYLPQGIGLNATMYLPSLRVICMYCFWRSAPMVIPLYFVNDRRAATGMSVLCFSLGV